MMFGKYFWRGIVQCLGVVALIFLWVANWMVGSVCIVVVVCTNLVLRKQDEIICLLKAKENEKTISDGQ